MSVRARAVAIMGPTASGKTDLALALADVLNGEVVSVDSALVYRGLDIGAAKPSLEERERVRHWLIDIRDPADPYSVADFVSDAKVAVRDILSRGRVPILVGGTMLYFKGLLEGISPMPPVTQDIRQRIEAEAMSVGWPVMHEKLKAVDPISAERIHPNHSQRIGRALEVWQSSGKPMSAWQVGGQQGLLDEYRWTQIALAPRDRSVLHKRIERRFKQMLALGVIDEVDKLRGRGDLDTSLPAIRAVGYRQVWEYLDGDYDMGVLQEKAMAATRQLAKRQLTWLRGWPGLQWVDTQANDGKMKDIQEIVRESLSICRQSAI